MSVTEHAKFSASKAPRWMRCPGSIALEVGCENTSSRFADEGTAAHTLAELCLSEGQPTIAFAGRLIDVNGTKFEVDEDMIENVQQYVSFCEALRKTADAVFIEHRVDYSTCIEQPNSFGTSDFTALVGPELVVVDLKYGMGVQVDAEENEQLMLYGLGALQEVELLYPVETVRLVIYQPRKNHISEWTTTPEHLRRFAETARMRAYQAMQPDAGSKFLAPGSKQCKFCPAKAICPAIQGEVLSTLALNAEGFDDLTQDTITDPANTALALNLTDTASLVDMSTGAYLASVLPKLDMIQDWCDAIKAQAHRELLNGREIPGYKLVTGKKGARSWTDAAAAEAAMKSMRLKQDEMYNFSLISPTAAEKLLKDTPKRWNRIASLIGQKDGAPTIALAEDKRPALVIAAAADDFTPVEQPVLEGADLV